MASGGISFRKENASYSSTTRHGYIQSNGRQQSKKHTDYKTICLSQNLAGYFVFAPVAVYVEVCLASSVRKPWTYSCPFTPDGSSSRTSVASSYLKIHHLQIVIHETCYTS